MKRNLLIGLILGAMLLTACATSTTTSGTPGVAGTTYPIPLGSQIPVDLTPAQLAAIQAVATKYNLSIDSLKILSTEAVTWPNGCLGVETPGTSCTQALVEGFKIIVQANGQQYELHTNQDGTIVVDATGVTQ